MKHCLLFLAVLLPALLLALGVHPGTGVQAFPEAKDYSFAYHSGTDDFHFFGTDVWAVRFDFSEVYPSLDISEFSVEKALLYLPQTGDSVRVELFTDVSGVPGTSLAWAKVPVTTNNLEIQFPTAVQNDSLWMVVTYPTNFANRFVSASAGDGSHSYYWNANAQTPFFQSLSQAGYGAELLFGVSGEFVLSGMDLELVDFGLSGLIEPREQVGPVFSVYNHSDNPVNSAVLGLNVYSPDPGFAFYDEIQINQSIPPRSMLVFDENSSEYPDHLFSLPATPMQIKLRGALTSEFQDSDPQGNNVKLIHRFSFDEESPVYLAENFTRWDSVDQISLIQDQFNLPGLHRLYYFPILSDTLGNVASQIRFNWYDFNSLPRTSIGGDLRINGFSPDYSADYQQLANEVLVRKTFISSAECRFNYNNLTDVLTAQVNLSNANTLLYNSATEYNLVTNARLSVGLFRRETIAGNEHFTIDRWLTHAAALNGTLGAGETMETSFSFSLNNMPLNVLEQDYRLYYWLQLNDGGTILYSGYSDFSGVVSNQDDLLPSPVLLITGNPLRPSSIMKLSAPGSGSLVVDVFNIRGQKIVSQLNNSGEIELSTDQFPSAGVYLLRAVIQNRNGKTAIIQKKINIIK